MKIKKRILSIALAGALTLGLLPAFSSPALAADGGTSYTLTIPSALNVANSGWNALEGGISAKGTLENGKKLVVTPTSENSWNLVANKGEETESKVGYNLAKETGTYSAAAEAPTWEFTELTADGTSQTAGIIVDDYSTKPAGTYQDTVTFTASVVDAATLVTAITLNKTATTISAGQIETLSVSSVTPDDATDQTVTWSSDNEAVATVDADGKVTAVALGTANITATANDGSGVTATCVVTVNKVVTINQSDWGGWGSSFTKDGVTVSAGMIDPDDGNLMGNGTFSTTLGNFTKIVVTTARCYASGTGWSGSRLSMTWAGTPASTVSFSGDFMGMGMTQTTIVCTIVPTN